MDYSSFYPQQYSTLTAENLQAANNAFAVNGNLPHLPQQNQPNGNNTNNNVAQLQQNMFYLDPFDTNVKPDSIDPDHASYSSIPPFSSDALNKDESDLYLDELDEVSRAANVAQNRRHGSMNGTHGNRRNHSPQGVTSNTVHLPPAPSDFDIQDMNTEFMDSMGGNSTVTSAGLEGLTLEEEKGTESRCAEGV
jgi:hypothetical protein